MANAPVGTHARSLSAWGALFDGFALMRPHGRTLFLAELVCGAVLVLCRGPLSWYIHAPIAMVLAGVLSAGMTSYLMRAYLGQPVSWDQLLEPLCMRPVALGVLLLIRPLLVAMVMLIVMTSGSSLLTGLSVALLVYASVLLALDVPMLLTQGVGPFTAMALSIRSVHRRFRVFCPAVCLYGLINGVLSVVGFPITCAALTVLAMRTLEMDGLLVDGRATDARLPGRGGAAGVAIALMAFMLGTSYSVLRIFRPEWLSPSRSLLTKHAGPRVSPEAQWIDDGQGHLFRVLESRIAHAATAPLDMVVVWQVRNRAATALDVRTLRVGVTDSEAAPQSSAVDAPGAQAVVAPNRDSAPLLFRLHLAQPLQSANPQWGVTTADGAALHFAVTLVPQLGATELEVAPPVEAYVPPLPWQPSPEALAAPPELSVLRPNARGCEWLRQSVGQPNQRLAQIPECRASIALSGDGRDAAIVLRSSGRILWRAADGTQRTLEPRSGALAAFDPNGALNALFYAGSKRQAVVYDGAQWTPGPQALDNLCIVVEGTPMNLRPLPLLRPFHCRLLHAYMQHGEPQPLTLDACTTPDHEFYDAPPGQAPRAALASVAGPLVGHLAKRPQALAPPLFVAGPGARNLPLAGLDAPAPAELRVAIRGPYALVHALDADGHDLGQTVYDLRSGQGLMAVAPGGAAVAFWPLAGGPAGHLVPQTPAPPAAAPAPPFQPVAKPAPARAKHSGKHRGRR